MKYIVTRKVNRDNTWNTLEFDTAKKRNEWLTRNCTQIENIYYTCFANDEVELSEQEETTMDNKAITFEVNGTTYNSNEKGNRFYKTIGTQKIRIGEAEWNKAMEKFNELKVVEYEASTDLWEQEADAEKQAREDKVEADAKQAEEAVAKKTKKKSKKNVAFEGVFETGDGETFKVNHVTLTEKQVDFIKHVPDTCFYENGLESTMWTDVLADEIGGQFADKPMTVGAMISTLREKSVIYVSEDRINGKKCKFFGFTDLGKRVARELGLN